MHRRPRSHRAAAGAALARPRPGAGRCRGVGPGSAPQAIRRASSPRCHSRHRGSPGRRAPTRCARSRPSRCRSRSWTAMIVAWRGRRVSGARSIELRPSDAANPLRFAVAFSVPPWVGSFVHHPSPLFRQPLEPALDTGTRPMIRTHRPHRQHTASACTRTRTERDRAVRGLPWTGATTSLAAATSPRITATLAAADWPQRTGRAPTFLSRVLGAPRFRSDPPRSAATGSPVLQPHSNPQDEGRDYHVQLDHVSSS